MPDLAANCWFLTGPTASGKTAVGLELAEGLGAEIISLDSMALYTGMDLGTAKPSPAQRQRVPHHLVDIIGPDEEFSLAQYVAAAHRAAAAIHGRNREVLFVGGTPLYLKALLRGIFEGPPADPALRRQLFEQSRQHPPGCLHEQLRAVDPAAAARLHPNDTRRLIRALEVFRKTGLPITHWQRQFERAHPAEACRVFVLDWPREVLYDRINRRVEEMFAQGLVDEVRGLLAAGRPLSRTARQAVGYREVIAHLEGQHGLEETVQLVQQHTRQLAKRQGTWFRSLSECRLVPLCAVANLAAIARGIAEASRRAV